MKIREQIALCSGADEWNTKAFPKENIPSFRMSDGPNGLRIDKKPATCFPTASIAACCFDTDLMERYGYELAREAKAENVGLILGPGVNIKRNPLCGRNFEYFSEDPLVSGYLGAAVIRGIQSTGIGSCLKHFACNNQEYYRMTSDSLIDERTLREIYLLPFEVAVKEGHPRAVMGAYNKLNGTYCCSNKWLLTDVLRKEWHYEGAVITDWTAVEDRTDAFLAGCDLVMPGGNAYGEREVLRNIANGTLPREKVTRSARRVARMARKAQKALIQAHVDLRSQHEISHQTAQKVAEESMVLLKNAHHILPLDGLEEVVFLGKMAEEIRYQGSGSSRVTPTKLEQVTNLYPQVPYAPGYDANGDTDDALIAEAVALAQKAKTVILFAGLPDIYESEGYDRANMKMPDGHNRLIEEVAKVNQRVIVVLECGSAVEVPWADDVEGILYAGLSGQAGAKAIMRILLGEVNPSGKLAETWPMHYEDAVTAGYYGKGHRNAQYREGIYVGYRYYETAGVPVRFPFGCGLSYTTFAYSNPRLDRISKTLTVTVKNTGKRAGKETLFLFVSHLFKDCYRPKRVLKHFEKVDLEAGERMDVVIQLDERDFAIWDHGWIVDEGYYLCEVTGSPLETGTVLKIEADLDMLDRVNVGSKWQVRQQADAMRPTHESRNSDAFSKLANWYRNPVGAPSEQDFLTLYKQSLPDITANAAFDINTNFEDLLEESRVFRKLFDDFEQKMADELGRDSAEYKGMVAMAKQSPLRALQNNQKWKHHRAQACADLANRKYLSMIRHFFS